MPSPSNEDRICAMFDSFCKKVSRNFLIDLQRANESRKKYIADEPVELLRELYGQQENYPSDSLVLYAVGYACLVESEPLYRALLSLPDKQRWVLLLGFWHDMSDGEISVCLEVSTRTVYNLRKRAFAAVRKYYEREKLYPWIEL